MGMYYSDGKSRKKPIYHVSSSNPDRIWMYGSLTNAWGFAKDVLKLWPAATIRVVNIKSGKTWEVS